MVSCIHKMDDNLITKGEEHVWDKFKADCKRANDAGQSL